MCLEFAQTSFGCNSACGWENALREAVIWKSPVPAHEMGPAVFRRQPWASSHLATIVFPPKIPPRRFAIRRAGVWGRPFASWPCYGPYSGIIGGLSPMRPTSVGANRRHGCSGLGMTRSSPSKGGCSPLRGRGPAGEQIYGTEHRIRCFPRSTYVGLVSAPLNFRNGRGE